ncbi:MAG: hypothetical protein D6805_03805 [Planctomycetota bacterium]|nr:MAG: hypothetical protein D6805_03805 [Planctomycetota bacterium]
MQKTTLAAVLVAIAFVLGIYIFAFELKKKPISEDSSQRRVFQLTSDEITALEIKGPKGHFRADKVAGEHWIVKNLETKQEDTADGEAIGDICAAIANLSYYGKIHLQQEGVDLSKFNIALSGQPNERKLTFWIESQPYSIYFSYEDQLKELKSVFIYLPDRRMVYAVPSHFKNILQKTFLDLREKTMGKFNIYSVDYALIRTPKRFYQLRKRSTSPGRLWYLASWPASSELFLSEVANPLAQALAGIPVKRILRYQEILHSLSSLSALGRGAFYALNAVATLDEATYENRVLDFLRSLAHMKAQKILDYNEANLDRVKQGEVVCDILLLLPQKKKRYLVYKDSGGRYSVILNTSERKGIFQFGPKLTSFFSFSLEKFRSAKVFYGQPYEVQNLEVILPKEKWTFHRLTKGWETTLFRNGSKRPIPFPLDNEAIEDFLQKLFSLQRRRTFGQSARLYQIRKRDFHARLLAPERWGLYSPSATIRMKLDQSQNHRQMELRIGQALSKNVYIAQLFDAFPPFSLDLRSIASIFRTGLLHFHSPKVFPSLEEIRSFVFEVGGKKRKLERQKQEERFLLQDGRGKTLARKEEAIYAFLDAFEDFKGKDFFYPLAQNQAHWGKLEIHLTNGSQRVFLLHVPRPPRGIVLQERGKNYAFWLSSEFLEKLRKLLD